MSTSSSTAGHSRTLIAALKRKTSTTMSGAGKMFRSLVDSVFGYDFFISYAHKDGRRYAEVLQHRLTAVPYEFEAHLDTRDYVAGDDIGFLTRQRIRNSTKLIVLARPHALTESNWVRREADVFRKRNRTPVVIDINKSIDSVVAKPGTLSELVCPKEWKHIEDCVIGLPEFPADGEPGDHVLDELARGFKVTRQKTKRLRIFASAAAIFAIISIVAVWQYQEASRSAEAEQVARLRAERQAWQALGVTAKLQANQPGMAEQALVNGLSAVAPPLARGEEPPAEAVSGLKKALDQYRLSLPLKHFSMVETARIIAGSQRIATSARDKRIRIWNLATGVMRQQSEPVGEVVQLVAGEDGWPIIGRTRQGKIVLWRKGLARISCTFGEPGSIASTMWLDAGSDNLLAGYEDGSIHSWSISRCKQALQFWKIEGRHERISAIRHIAKDLIVAGTSNGAILLLNAGDGSIRQSWTEHQGQIVDLADFRDGKRFVSVSSDKTARIWSIGQTSSEHVLTSPNSSGFRRVRISADGNTIATTVWDRNVGIWNAQSGTLERSLPHRREISSIEFHPQLSMLATGTDGGEFVIWDYQTGRRLFSSNHHTDAVENIDFNTDGTRFVTASLDKTARVWNLSQDDSRMALDHQGVRVSGAVWTKDATEMLTADWGGVLRRWKIAGNQATSEVLTKHENAIGRLVIASRAPVAISAGWDKVAKAIFLESPIRTNSFNRHSERVYVAAISADGTHAITGGAKGDLWYWKTEKPAEAKKLAGHESSIIGVALSGKTNIGISASEQDNLAISWNLSTGKVIRRFTKHTSWISSVAFDVSGTNALTADRSGTAYLWNANTGDVLHKLDHDSESINVATIADSGQFAATGTTNGTVRIWRLGAGKLHARLIGGSNKIETLSFTKDGKTIISSGSQGNVFVWDVEKGVSKGSYSVNGADIYSMSITSDGNFLLTGSNDGVAHVTRIDSATMLQQACQLAQAIRIVTNACNGVTSHGAASQ